MQDQSKSSEFGLQQVATFRTAFRPFQHGDRLFFFSGSYCCLDLFEVDAESGAVQKVFSSQGDLRDYVVCQAPGKTYLISLTYSVLVYELHVSSNVAFSPVELELVSLPPDSKISFLNEPPQCRCDFGAGYSRGFIVVFGGTGCEDNRVFYSFRTCDGMWFRDEFCPENPQNMIGQAMISLGDERLLMCGGTNDEGQELRSCYTVQIREDYEEVIRGFEENTYYIEVELVKFAPEEREIAVGANSVVDPDDNRLVTFKNRAIKIYDAQSLKFICQCVVENVSEDAYVFRLKSRWYLYDREVGRLYRVDFQQLTQKTTPTLISLQ